MASAARVREIPPTEIAIFGRMHVRVARTSRAWELSADALVIPAGRQGDLQGGLATELSRVLGTRWNEVLGRVSDALRSSKFAPHAPLLIEQPEASPILGKYLIIATVFGPGEAQPDVATHGIIRLAAANNIRSVTLPLLGSGAGGGDSVRTAEQMFGALEEAAVEGAPEEITITTMSSPAFNRLREMTRLRDTTRARPALAIVTEFLQQRDLTINPDARRAIILMGELAPQRARNNRRITTRLVLFGLIESGWEPRGDDPLHDVVAPMLSAMRNQSSGYQRLRDSYFKNKPLLLEYDESVQSIESLSANSVALLDSACAITRAIGSKSLGPSAILAAIVEIKAGRVLGSLDEIGLTLDQPRAALRAIMQPAKPDLDRVGAAETSARTYVTTGLRTDNPNASADDLLNVMDEVRAFARVIASRRIMPPLSIGIFGEWGSGKTFFMERIYDEVDRITHKEAPHNEKMFHSGIVQIRFNAWHYIETNLWASLVEFIFRELDGWLREKEKNVEALFEQLNTSKQLRLDAAQDLIERRKTLKNAEAGLQDARAKHESALQERAAAPLGDIWGAAAALFRSKIDDGEKQQLRRAANDLGLPQLGQSAEGFAQLVRDSRSQAERARLVGTGMLRRMGSLRNVLLASASLLLVPLALELGRAWLESLSAGWLAGLAENIRAGVLSAVSVISSITLLGGVMLRRVTKALDLVDQFQVKLDESVAVATKDQREKMVKMEESVATARQALTEAERKLSVASDSVAAAEQSYENDTARGRLNRFIREKIAGGGYAKHLGLVATIRQDFGQLAAIMREQSLDETIPDEVAKSRALYKNKLAALIAANPDILTEKEKSDLEKEIPPEQLRHFSRIVLYIDDLDRCPPDKVADVLQAIHMLLFFPLFVVVVAVDARWITRSLEAEFPHLLLADPAENDSEAPPVGAPHRRVSLRPALERLSAVPSSNALDYLEKIFQIPFWV
ncbi:MAG TPA: P-loop NTPase fold protein, partial [Steroidobacteraceae bacterium]|nr:P-loop NTPase fold protein [Steroidobacteraceae bacterium]